jgi:ribulose-phosphate 3-epimerase
MSVNPGFGNQKLIPNCLNKVRHLERRRRELGLQFAIEIDGGVNLENLGDVVRAGCDWIVAGSTIFGSDDPATTVTRMQQIARNATAIHV